MPDEKKDFFNIAEMSKAWRIAGEDIRKSKSSEEILLYWQVSALIAVAQQLAVISSRLDQINETMAHDWARRENS
jgi:hypothetical protein